MEASPAAHHDRPTAQDAVRAQVAETDRSRPAILPTTDSQLRGAGRGIVAGAVFGAALLFPFGFVNWVSEVGLGARLLAVVVIGTIAGGTAGAVYGGGRRPELDGASPDPSGPGGNADRRGR